MAMRSSKQWIAIMTDWVESLSGCFPCLLPLVALVGLWVARCSEDAHVRQLGERTFMAMMLVVGGGTLRTIVVNDPFWLIHTASLSIMIVGAIFPYASLSAGIDGVGPEIS